MLPGGERTVLGEKGENRLVAGSSLGSWLLPQGRLKVLLKLVGSKSAQVADGMLASKWGAAYGST